jgi:alpha-tubulin suppressor-like RCC1 family protein
MALPWVSRQTGRCGHGAAPALASWVMGPRSPGSFKAVSAGFGYALALRLDGTVLGWGDGSLGQLAIAPFVVSPVQVPLP